jgi:predicted nucleic-acid-binding protein
MAGVDTNVLVRWLVDDGPRQSKQVAALLKNCANNDEVLFVPVTVMLELEWVLRSRYGLEKSAVLQAMNALLETRELEFQLEPAIERALHAYRLGKADFADCLHSGLCAAEGRSPMLTFDAKAAKPAAAELIRA